MLILGPSGAGKSDLLLRLLGRGWNLVADDQVEVSADSAGLLAAPAPALSGMLEVRGLGLFQDLPHHAPARLRLAVDLLPGSERPPRLPEPATYEMFGHSLPRLALNGHEPSAPEKLTLALQALRGEARLSVGFAA